VSVLGYDEGMPLNAHQVSLIFKSYAVVFLLEFLLFSHLESSWGFGGCFALFPQGDLEKIMQLFLSGVLVVSHLVSSGVLVGV